MISSPETVVQSLVWRFQLQPHPEGGYYREVYRSAGVIPSGALREYEGERNYCTSIYFLITSGNFSAFHRIRQDEIWHFYAGSALHVHAIGPDGKYTCHVVGHNIERGESPQVVIPAGEWFASAVRDRDSYSFVGCTVAPGFDFRDFELAKRTELAVRFPQHQELIGRFTRQ